MHLILSHDHRPSASCQWQSESRQHDFKAAIKALGTPKEPRQGKAEQGNETMERHKEESHSSSSASKSAVRPVCKMHQKDEFDDDGAKKRSKEKLCFALLEVARCRVCRSACKRQAQAWPQQPEVTVCSFAKQVQLLMCQLQPATAASSARVAEAKPDCLFGKFHLFSAAAAADVCSLPNYN